MRQWGVDIWRRKPFWKDIHLQDDQTQLQIWSLASHSRQKLSVGSNPMFESVLAYVVIDSKGHYIVEEYVNKVVNKYPPNQPWQVSLYLHLLSCIHAPDQKFFWQYAVSLYLPAPCEHAGIGRVWVTSTPQFGESQLTPKTKLPQIIQAVIRWAGFH